MAKFKWEEMRPDEFVAARTAAPVAYVAIGPLEWHSLHLPLGTDTLKAYHYVCAVAERVGGVVYPPLYCAINAANRHDLPLTSTAFGPELFGQIIDAVLDFIATNGFKLIFILNGHGGQLWRVQQAAEAIREKYGITVYPTQDDMHSRDGLYTGDHAGGEETSAMLHIAQDLVDLSKLPSVPGPLDNDKLIIHSPKPDPRTQSSADYGRDSAEVIIEDMARVVTDLLAGKDAAPQEE